MQVTIRRDPHCRQPSRLDVDMVVARQRSAMLGRRRPVMQAWAAFLAGGADAKVVPIAAGRKASGVSSFSWIAFSVPCGALSAHRGRSLARLAPIRC
jgi:hypothetical protein